MSVEIFGVEESSSRFNTVVVSGEETFNTFWRKAITELRLQFIGNGVWLYKKDLPEILCEFEQVKIYMGRDQSIPESERKYIIRRIDEILEHLKSEWNMVPEAERLWMG